LKFSNKTKDGNALTEAEIDELKLILENGIPMNEQTILGNMTTMLCIVSGQDVKLKGTGKTTIGPMNRIRGLFA
jgi:hypothetical protein